MFFADGFEETEALATADVMRRGGIDVKKVSITGSLGVSSSHGVHVLADMTFGEFKNSVVLEGTTPQDVMVDPDDRLVRVIARDTMERGRDVGKVIDRYEKTLKPMHLQFIEPSKRYADLILPQGGHNQVGIDMLIATIENHLKNN